jgi:hypothetical protein
VRRVREHLECLDSIGLERAVEYQETSEIKLALDLFPSDVVDLESALVPYYKVSL